MLGFTTGAIVAGANVVHYDSSPQGFLGMLAFPGQGKNADLSKGIEDAQRCSHACSQDVGEEEIDAPALHLASLADSDGRQGRDESYQDGQQNDQDRQPHPCITLVTDKREIIMITIT